MSDQINLFVPFSKVDPEQRLVGGWATVEEPDRQHKVVDYESAKAALSAWAGNMREMHQPRAVGKAVSVQPDDAGRRVWLESYVSRSADGENTWTKIQEGILTGYSIAGSLSRRVPEVVKDAATGKLLADAREYVEAISEVSYVDLPAAPSAVYAFVKADGAPADFLADAATDEPSEGATQGDRGDSTPPADLALGPASTTVTAEPFDPPAARAAEATPAAVAEAATDDPKTTAPEPDIVVAYAAVGLDLAKRAATLRKVGARNAAPDQAKIDQIHDLAVAAGATCPGATNDPSTPDEGGDAEKVAKAAQPVSAEALAEALVNKLTQSLPFAKAADLDALKGELLGAYQAHGELLAKIAAQPMPGGPLRYADDPRRLFGESSAAPVNEAVSAVIAKVGDPALREELGRALAASEIAASRR